MKILIMLILIPTELHQEPQFYVDFSPVVTKVLTLHVFNSFKIDPSLESPSSKIYKNIWMWSWATSSKWPYLSRVVGQEDLQKSLPTSSILRFW